ncbi:MAG: hypothetical protein J7M25_10070 [Deltaproteobacteria bacterium]|nr:hypothetical protein [Deltaproteobacteria bacterium]
MKRFLIISAVAFITLAFGPVGCSDDSSSGGNNQGTDAAVHNDAAQTNDGGQTNDAAQTNDGGQTNDAAQTNDGGQTNDAAQANDGGTTQDGSQSVDGGTTSDPLGFGSGCQCQGSDCKQFGVPVPNGGNNGTIVGCDHVDQPWTGADLVCLRTYTGTLANNTYFANGYCGLMATSCTGSSTICNNATFGNYDQMTACPTGTVMIQDSQTVSSFGQNATVNSKTCVKSCTASGQCRETETDPVDNNNPTQYQCINKNGVQFCYDPRDLTTNYTATQY